MIHELKTLPIYFEEVIEGRKSFEVRKNDRSFKVGDMLALNEYDAEKKEYTGNSCLVVVDYILKDDNYCKNGFVIMAIKPCEVYQRRGYDMACRENRYAVPYATKKGESETV